MEDDRWILPALAINPALPDELLLALARMNDEPSQLAAVSYRRRHLPAHVAAVLADSPYPHVRRELAIRADLPDDLIVQLARDPDRSVRLHVVVRPEEIWPRPWPRAHFAPLEAYEILAGDDNRRILYELLASRDVPDRIKLMLAGHPEFGDIVVLRYGEDADAAAVYDRMIRDPDRRAEALAERRFRPSADQVEALLADPAVRKVAVERVPLTAALATRLTADPDPVVRAAVVGNPDLPDDLIAALGHDPDESVRQRLLRRPNLSVETLDAIDIATGPEDRTGPIDWLFGVEDPAVLATYARSRHLEIRRTVARIGTISDETVELLAADEDYVVRLLLAEANTERAPVALLREILLTWEGYSTGIIARSPSVSVELIDELIRMDDGKHLWMLDHRATDEWLARLADDPDPTVAAYARHRLRMGSADEIRRGLDDPSDHVRKRSAANPKLPAAVIRELWDRATSLPIDDRSRLDEGTTPET